MARGEHVQCTGRSMKMDENCYSATDKRPVIDGEDGLFLLSRACAVQETRRFLTGFLFPLELSGDGKRDKEIDRQTDPDTQRQPTPLVA